MSFTVKILDQRDVNGTPFLNVALQPMGVVIRDVAIRQGRNGAFVSLPSQKYEQNGETKYSEYVAFLSREAREAFTNGVLEAYGDGGGAPRETRETRQQPARAPGRQPVYTTDDDDEDVPF
jgi:DNA-binding cell septation regulator SpoVG